MAEEQQGQGQEKQEKHEWMCEVCKSKYGHDKAQFINFACCGHKMTKLEVLYRSEPSPSGP